jgi:hypothetical protein
LISLVGVGAFFVTSACSTVLAFSLFFSCSGDGGSPYAARDSSYGQLCEAGAVDLTGVALLFGVPLVMIVAATVAIARRRILTLLITGGVVAVTMVAVLIGGAAIPDECSTEQSEAGADCDKY